MVLGQREKLAVSLVLVLLLVLALMYMCMMRKAVKRVVLNFTPGLDDKVNAIASPAQLVVMKVKNKKGTFLVVPQQDNEFVITSECVFTSDVCDELKGYTVSYWPMGSVNDGGVLSYGAVMIKDGRMTIGKVVFDDGKASMQPFKSMNKNGPVGLVLKLDPNDGVF